MSGVLKTRPLLRFWLLRSAWLIAFVARVSGLAISGVVAGRRRGGIITLMRHPLPFLLPVLMAVDFRHLRANWRTCNRWGIMSGAAR
ncbi:MAG: hypothetical protein Kow0013_10410 [Pararhodobacter sp.]